MSTKIDDNGTSTTTNVKSAQFECQGKSDVDEIDEKSANTECGRKPKKICENQTSTKIEVESMKIERRRKLTNVSQRGPKQ